jgi:hypothetical protein
MAITYPLIIPGVIGAAKANLKKFDAVGEVISPFDGSAQQQQFADQHWELDLEWPEMTWAQYAALDAFSGALHGKLGSFLWGPPLSAAPLGRGNLGGTPTCVGTDLPGSNTLTTQGWLPNQGGLLLPGDFLMLGVPYQAGTAEVQNTFAVGAPVVAGSLVTLSGIDVALSSGGVPIPSTTSPPWIYPGASIYVQGTGVTDGGPFVLLTVTNTENDVGQWVTTMTFNNPAADFGSGNPLPTIALSAASNASGGETLYTFLDPYPSGASDALVGATFEVTGFEEFRQNDGEFACTASTNMSITLNNPNGVADSEYAYAQQLTAPSGGSGGIVIPASSFFPRLYQYVNPSPLASDGGGNASLDIFPSIREAPAAGMAVALTNPQGTFRLAANRRESPATKTKTFTFMMKCREAI